jgi:hypothetical protein
MTDESPAIESATGNPPSATKNDQGSAITPEVLKSAYNAFKKRWKLTRLDNESRIGKSPMSGGRPSAICGIVAPDQFPKEVWEALVTQGRIKYAGQGFYSMP